MLALCKGKKLLSVLISLLILSSTIFIAYMTIGQDIRVRVPADESAEIRLHVPRGWGITRRTAPADIRIQMLAVIGESLRLWSEPTLTLFIVTFMPNSDDKSLQECASNGTVWLAAGLKKEELDVQLYDLSKIHGMDRLLIEVRAENRRFISMHSKHAEAKAVYGVVCMVREEVWAKEEAMIRSVLESFCVR